jgi:hypothetical protein
MDRHHFDANPDPEQNRHKHRNFGSGSASKRCRSTSLVLSMKKLSLHVQYLIPMLVKFLPHGLSVEFAGVCW